jgi:trk system potassium uptake protein TrkA
MFVIVAGLGVLGTEVVRKLTQHRHDVVAIDIDEEICNTLYAQLGTTVVRGNATDLHVLEEAGAAKADMIIPLMHRDADNLSCAVLARTLGVPRVVARLRDPGYEASYVAAGVTQIVRATEVLREQILVHVEHPQVSELMSLRDGAVQIVSVVVPPRAAVAGATVQDIAHMRGFPQQCLLLGILRGEGADIEIPRGHTRVAEGDTVLVITAERDIDKVTKILTRS